MLAGSLEDWLCALPLGSMGGLRLLIVRPAAAACTPAMPALLWGRCLPASGAAWRPGRQHSDTHQTSSHGPSIETALAKLMHAALCEALTSSSAGVAGPACS